MQLTSNKNSLTLTILHPHLRIAGQNPIFLFENIQKNELDSRARNSTSVADQRDAETSAPIQFQEREIAVRIVVG